MKFLLFLLAAIVFSASPAASQTRKTSRSQVKKPARAVKTAKPAVRLVSAESDEPPMPKLPKPKMPGNVRFASDVFKDVPIGKWGVAFVSVPDDLTNETESNAPTENGRIKWTTYSRNWKQSGAFYPSSLEADLDVTTWDSDFKNLVPELRRDLATPENLVLLDFTGDFQKKNKPDSPVLDVQILKIGDVEGTFSIYKLPSGENRFIVAWATYRYYQNKAQRISVTVTGRKEEMAKARKIINSLRLETPPADSPVKTP